MVCETRIEGVRVGEDHRIEAIHFDRERRPVAPPKLVEGLEETAVNEQPGAIGLRRYLDPVTIPTLPRKESLIGIYSPR